VLAVAAGGVLGAEARYGISLLMPREPAGFPWSTLVINASGCALIGVLMTVTRPTTAYAGVRQLTRPFLGIGVLGGYTTFSAYAVDVQALLVADRPAVALAYLLATPLAALSAVWSATSITRRTLRRGPGAPGQTPTAAT